MDFEEPRRLPMELKSLLCSEIRRSRNDKNSRNKSTSFFLFSFFFFCETLGGHEMAFYLKGIWPLAGLRLVDLDQFQWRKRDSFSLRRIFIGTFVVQFRVLQTYISLDKGAISAARLRREKKKYIRVPACATKLPAERIYCTHTPTTLISDACIRLLRFSRTHNK